MIRFLPYVIRSAWRNKVRTMLTVCGVGVAVTLITGLGAILDSRNRAVAATSETVLLVSEWGEW